MATSKTPDGVRTLRGDAVALAWGCWAELGAAGWARTHRDWAIDPEPLVLFTAWLGDSDPRLRDAATDWCIQHWRHVSRVRLRNLLREQRLEVQQAFGEFSATVNVHTRASWPGATTPRTFAAPGRSNLPSLTVSSLVWLRVRAMFGLGARAEILRHFLASPERFASVGVLAKSAGYTKRNVAEEAEILARAGVLAAKRTGNRFYYALAREAELREFVGEFPAVVPDWVTLLDMVEELLLLEETVDGLPDAAIDIEAHQALQLVQRATDSLRVRGPQPPDRGQSTWTSLHAWARGTLARMGAGEWPA